MSVEFIADIGANHDGDLCRALRLIRLAAEAGADVVKFQGFHANTIVSAEGFNALPPMAHQKAWDKSVVDVYRAAELPMEWVPVLAKECERNNVEFAITPYSLEHVAACDKFVRRWKIGSGDITYRPLLIAVARTGKPVILSTGASTLPEVAEALAVLEVAGSGPVTVLQCNTDYSGGAVERTNLRAMREWGDEYDYGLSDHTKSLAVVLGAVALGASIIERHFDDYDNPSSGPDSYRRFAMDQYQWRAMVACARELESALGDGIKKVEPNEVESRIVQRRCWRAARDLPAGHVIQEGDVVALRPCPNGAMPPMCNVIGLELTKPMAAGDALTSEHSMLVCVATGCVTYDPVAPYCVEGE